MKVVLILVLMTPFFSFGKSEQRSPQQVNIGTLSATKSKCLSDFNAEIAVQTAQIAEDLTKNWTIDEQNGVGPALSKVVNLTKEKRYGKILALAMQYCN